MGALGYIVSDRKLKEAKGFVKVVSDIKLADLAKPTLLVGQKLGREHSDNFSLLDRKINDNLYWTFGRTENRYLYEKDIEKFQRKVITDIKERVRYYYVNPFKLPYSKAKKIVNLLFSPDKKYIYISRKMLYVLYGEDVIGISLLMLEYIGINVKKLLSRLYSNKDNSICTSTGKCELDVRSELPDCDYVVPYFMALADKE